MAEHATTDTILSPPMAGYGQRILDVHHELAGKFSKPLLGELFRATWIFAANAAGLRDRNIPVSRAELSFLGYCAAAGVFQSGLPGGWGDQAYGGEILVKRAGLSVDAYDAALSLLRTRYAQPGVLLPAEALAVGYERNLDPVQRAEILADNASFRLGAHRLPVNETQWTIVSEPFYQQIPQAAADA